MLVSKTGRWLKHGKHRLQSEGWGALPHGSGRRHGYSPPSPPHDLWVEVRLWRFTSCIHHFRERGGPLPALLP